MREEQRNKKSIAQEILRFEVEKKTKLDPQERFKFIMKRKMEERRKKVQQARQDKAARPMSERAQKALKDIAMKKAAKEQKALRRMVIVTPRNYTNGRLTKDGSIYDIAGNKVGKVQTKDGRMNTYLGTFFGYYKPKNHRTNALIQGAIDQWSPYYINLRKMQAMQAAGLDPRTGQPLHQDTMSLYGGTNQGSPLYGGGDMNNMANNPLYAMHGGLYRPQGAERFRDQHGDHLDDQGHDLYGDAANGIGRGSAIAATVHGTASNNVWGNYADNAWGTSYDNVMGTNNQDVWGQATGNPYGSFGKTIQVFGTGNGNNYIKALIRKMSQLFGLNTKATRVRLKAINASRPGSSSRPTRSAGPRVAAGPRPSAGPRGGRR